MIFKKTILFESILNNEIQIKLKENFILKRLDKLNKINFKKKMCMHYLLSLKIKLIENS